MCSFVLFSEAKIIKKKKRLISEKSERKIRPNYSKDILLRIPAMILI